MGRQKRKDYEKLKKAERGGLEKNRQGREGSTKRNQRRHREERTRNDERRHCGRVSTIKENVERVNWNTYNKAEREGLNETRN